MDASVEAYLQTVMAELALLTRDLSDGAALERMHWGGETPTLMQPHSIAELAAAIRAAVPFAGGYEFLSRLTRMRSIWCGSKRFMPPG